MSLIFLEIGEKKLKKIFHFSTESDYNDSYTLQNLVKAFIF